MSFIVGHDWLMFILVAICVFAFVYTNTERVIKYLYDKSLGSREHVIAIMDKMLLDIDKKRLTMILLLTSFGLGIIFFLVCWPNLILGAILGSIVTIVGWSVPKIVMENLWESRCNKAVNQMVDAMTIMGNGIKAGLSITQSMERVVINMKGPLPQEFRLCLNKIRLGMTVEESLNEMSDRIKRQDIIMFVTAVNILKETGGNLAETFQTINTTVRERQKVEKKIESMTAQGIMQATIITMVPFLLIAMFYFMDPGYIIPLFTKPLGWAALFIMLALIVIGGVIMKKIVTIKV